MSLLFFSSWPVNVTLDGSTTCIPEAIAFPVSGEHVSRGCSKSEWVSQIEIRGAYPGSSIAIREVKLWELKRRSEATCGDDTVRLDGNVTYPFASSCADWGLHNPQFAVDGFQSHSPSHYFKSKVERNPFISLFLERNHCITKVEVLHRPDCCRTK